MDEGTALPRPFAVPDERLLRVAEEYGTPVYAYSRESMTQAVQALQEGMPGVDFFYSLKANPNVHICRALNRCGAKAEVSSAGELTVALQAGVDARDIIFVGPAKTRQELDLAIRSGVYAIVAESAGEILAAEDLARDLGVEAVRLLLRINTAEEPGAVETMVGGPSRFGFDQERVAAEVGELDLDRCRIAGIQVYSASQVLDAGWLVAHMETVVRLAVDLSCEMGFELECVDFGGGYGVPYSEEETPLDMAKLFDGAAAVFARWSDKLGSVRLIVELGRYLVADSGVLLARVLRVKESRGKRFLITDGGLPCFTRPAFMHTSHPIRAVGVRPGAVPKYFEVCGRTCTPLDLLGSDVPLPDVDEGDLLAVHKAGAYGFSMSMLNFMSFDWPAEVMLTAEGSRLIRPRQPYQSVISVQLP